MRLEAARRSLLGQDQHQPHQEQQQQQQQQPQQQRLPINRRPVNAVKSAFITRSNNPHQDSFKKSIKTNPEDAVINKKKLPDYLAFLINIVWFYPVTFVLKVTFGVNFILNIPWKVIELAKYLTNLPFVAFEKGTKSVFAICHWTSNNVQGLLQLCIDYHFGRIFAIFVILWLIPFDDIKIMTYPLFGVLRLVLGTLYPAYASYKAVRTKNVREYVSNLYIYTCLWEPRYWGERPSDSSGERSSDSSEERSGDSVGRPSDSGSVPATRGASQRLRGASQRLGRASQWGSGPATRSGVPATREVKRPSDSGSVPATQGSVPATRESVSVSRGASQRLGGSPINSRQASRRLGLASQ
jgi:hypothetical protein